MRYIPVMLRVWLDANPEKVSESSTFQESSGRYYDILLAPGWITADGTHVVFESSAYFTE